MFEDRHNNYHKKRNRLAPYKNHLLFDMEKVTYYFSDKFFKKNHNSWFHDSLHRKDMKYLIDISENCNFEGEQLDWNNSSCQFKHFKGTNIAANHNKNLYYIDSFKENKFSFQSFVSFCNKKNVELYVCALPGSLYYNEQLSPKYRKDYYAVLEETVGNFQFIDFNDLDIFSDKDYIDANHLSESGAKKVMSILNDKIFEFTK